MDGKSPDLFLQRKKKWLCKSEFIIARNNNISPKKNEKTKVKKENKSCRISKKMTK